MSYHKIFTKSYDAQLRCYRYEIHGLVFYSSEDLSEAEVISALEFMRYNHEKSICSYLGSN